jgi:hypothetical protein
MRRIVWWMGFTACGIWAQSHVPGVDFLVPGLILSLQVEKASQTVWLGLVWLLLQEGMGSLPFGFGLLWGCSCSGAGCSRPGTSCSCPCSAWPWDCSITGWFWSWPGCRTGWFPPAGS